MVTTMGVILFSAMVLGSPAQREAWVYEVEPQSVFRFEKSTARAWLGVSVQDLTPKLAKANGNKVTEGAMVNDVERKSPADSAGIEEGDVIVEFNGRKIYDADDLRKAVGRAKPGTTISVVIDRKGTTKTLKVKVGRNPARRSRVLHSTFPFDVMTIGKTKAIGAELRPLGEQLADYFQVPDGRGVLVESVEKNSAAEKAGLKAGDVIVKIGNARVRDVQDVWEAFEEYDEGEKAEVEVIRKGSVKKLTVEIEDSDEGEYYEFRTRPRMRWFDDLDREIRLRINPRIEIEKIRPKLDGLGKILFERFHPDLDERRFEMDRLKNELRLNERWLEEMPMLNVNAKMERRLKNTLEVP